MKTTLFHLSTVLTLAVAAHAQTPQPSPVIPTPAATQEVPSAAASRPLEPYPARPTGEPPAGWKISLLENSKVESVTPVGPGKEIKISVAAYKLDPEAGTNILIMKDPLYNPLLKNDQKRTIGATITRYSEEVESLQQDLKEVIETLEMGLKNAPEPPKKETAPSAAKAEPKKKS
jgi:hypothetical protein